MTPPPIPEAALVLANIAGELAQVRDEVAPHGSIGETQAACSRIIAGIREVLNAGRVYTSDELAKGYDFTSDDTLPNGWGERCKRCSHTLDRCPVVEMQAHAQECWGGVVPS